MSNPDISVLIEYFDSKFDALAEVVSDVRRNMVTKAELHEALAPMKTDIKIIKVAMADLSRQVNEYEQRITCLEGV